MNIYSGEYCDHRAGYAWSVPYGLSASEDYFVCIEDDEASSVRGCIAANSSSSIAPDGPSDLACDATSLEVYGGEIQAPALPPGGEATAACPIGSVGLVFMRCVAGNTRAIDGLSTCQDQESCLLVPSDRRLEMSSLLPADILSQTSCTTMVHGNKIIGVPCPEGYSGFHAIWCSRGVLHSNAQERCTAVSDTTSRHTSTAQSTSTSSSHVRETTTASNTTWTSSPTTSWSGQPRPASSNDEADGGDGSDGSVVTALLVVAICICLCACVCMLMVKTLTTCRPKPSPPVVPQPVLLNNAWTRPGDGKGLPLYWSGLKRSREGWLLVEVRDSTVEALRSMLYVKHRNHLGHGKDAHKYPRKYNELVFHCAWRLEHEHLWGSFSASREAVGKRVGLLSQQGLKRDHVAPTLNGATEMPGRLHSEAKEVFLISGTKPENLLTIIDQGLSINFSGAGIYFTEDAAKADQYATPDSQKGLEELHKVLFKGGAKHPGEDLFYCLVARVALGWSAFTTDAATRRGTDQSVFHSHEKRALADIPGSTPPVPFQSLVMETGDAVKWYREFVLYANSQCYVEYIIAYKRVWNQDLELRVLGVGED
mmetsp:Transcript_35109/g.80377  ORF Transcript_35109/g.80377 Transcript_35109/m.80377 type:complete len:595 (+) Transcript_35109:1-1785(+)